MLFGGPYETRRAFIQTGAVALCGLAAAPALAKPRKPKDADWTETFDVIVIGSGPRCVRGGPVGS